MPLEVRRLGNTHRQASLLGLGGHRLLATPHRFEEASRLIGRALDLGVTYFDTARLYPESEVYLGKALGPRRQQVFLATKTHARDAVGATAQLQESLARLRTDYVDLWQLHDLRTNQDVERVFATGGAVEALVRAREAGLCRHLGVTGHRSPGVILRCMELFDFDAILIPVNPAEPHHESFLESVLPFARAKGIGVVAMYLYLGGRIASLPHFESVEPYLRFALSQDVSVALVGCDSARHLEENVAYASRFEAMSQAEQSRRIDLLEPDALSLMYYKF